MKKSGCVYVPEILLPREGTDMGKWAVIACDQHTSDRAYWDELENYVKDAPSTLRLTLPEIYLSGDCSARIRAIADTMKRYRKEGVFRKLERGFVLAERKTPYSPVRFGIVLAVDLDAYSYDVNAKAAIKATEATIVERIPPRLKIREGADVEFPHVMLLYNDREDSVLKDLKGALSSLEKLYDFELNMGGGHIRGYFVPRAEEIAARFEALADEDGLVFMVGDGNHSLATAKAAWEKIKAGLTEEERQSHPARYALAEAVNLYDDGIRFEAIHRIVTGVDAKKFAAGFPVAAEGDAFLAVQGEKARNPLGKDAAAAVKLADGYISDYIAENGGEVDYIHGEEEILRLTRERADSVGILLPKMDKADLFGTVKRHGCLPRKTFSMGESAEKRYYIEGKEIVKK
ncbi:MAG TPA: DUF1015 domain-containing protein [Candidatus Borkfalkia avistercoris]|uniref:DUF1015 domain-containing protein n=1 Tax=Candidatus Borkfalkia avistercoris TaxID=2838504 RepID=A0A9D2D0E6_9FIRM|nr:DUF1015 domain-containing protein [Candidatus Borkfalkia avistercoris]